LRLFRAKGVLDLISGFDFSGIMNLEALRKTGFIPDIQWILESYAAGHYE